MSSVSPAAELSTPQGSQVPAANPQRPKPQRVLACMLCQQRKVKCDRTFPCANCVRHKAQCVPATQARRRRRRYPERELLLRVRKYEELLRQNNIKFEPLHRGPGLEEKESPEGYYESDEDLPRAGLEDWSSVSASLKTEGASEAKSAIPFISNYYFSISVYPEQLALSIHIIPSIWQAIAHETQEPSNEHDSPIANVLESTIKNAWNELADDDHMLFGSRHTAVDLSTLHPEPVHIFRLWQIYLNNVDPLFKVTHTPTLQARIIEATSNLQAVDPTLEALMFSIYCVATGTLADSECQAIFGLSKEDHLVKCQFGCQQALMNAKFLRSSDRDCLAALFLYLLSMRTGMDPRSLSSMLGLTIRIAKLMGIHNESSLAKCSVFEAEMRRRLWWSLMFYDTRMSEKADYKDASLAPTWDCKIPLNVNDSDLRPDMTEPPAGKGMATEAVFVVVRSELAEFVRHSSFHLDFTNPALKPIAKELPDGVNLDTLEKQIEQEYLKFCDPGNPIHFVTIWTARGYLARSRLMAHYATYPKTSVHQNDAQRDAALSQALIVIECDTKAMDSPVSKGYLWHIQSYFPFPAYMHIIQDLRQRPLSKQADRAWEAMGASYKARFPPPVVEYNTLSLMFGRSVLQAWEAREIAHGSAQPLHPPWLVSAVREREEAIMQAIQDVGTQEPGELMSMDFDSLLDPIPVGLPGDELLFSSPATQNTAEGAGSVAYSNVEGSGSLDFGETGQNWLPGGWRPT